METKDIEKSIEIKKPEETLPKYIKKISEFDLSFQTNFYNIIITFLPIREGIKVFVEEKNKKLKQRQLIINDVSYSYKLDKEKGIHFIKLRIKNNKGFTEEVSINLPLTVSKETTLIKNIIYILIKEQPIGKSIITKVKEFFV